MRLYNLQGELLRSVKIKSGHWPWGIAATRNGSLVYADFSSLNLVSETQRQTLIRPWGWRPRELCSTSSLDFLVIMTSDYFIQTKVVRYSENFTEKQSIQRDDQGKSLYSSSGFTKFLNENRNLDICVADYLAGAVVVVSAAGKLRFRYTGPPSTSRESFRPVGITTDSLGNILTSDNKIHCIHIIDQDGHFLHYIQNCGLQRPWGICVDSRNNLFVSEETTGQVKKLQYYK